MKTIAYRSSFAKIWLVLLLIFGSIFTIIGFVMVLNGALEFISFLIIGFLMLFCSIPFFYKSSKVSQELIKADSEKIQLANGTVINCVDIINVEHSCMRTRRAFGYHSFGTLRIVHSKGEITVHDVADVVEVAKIITKLSTHARTEAGFIDNVL